MRTRKDVLTDLFFLNTDLSKLQNELSQYSWDVKKPILMISKQDFSCVLKKIVENEINFEDLVNWANIIECREDLDFEIQEMQEIIFELANPEINGKITNERLLEIINDLNK